MTLYTQGATLPLGVVFFDFSGVLAEEGFVEGLKEIGRRNGKNPDAFLRTVADICWSTGYVNGKIGEAGFWQSVRKETGVNETDEHFREALLSRFLIRLWMLKVVDRVREAGPRVAILSDHTNWLDEMHCEHGIFQHFDRVFNSFHEGLNKRQTEFFQHACNQMQIMPRHALFIDDNPSNVERAATLGMKTIHYTDYESFASQLREYVPGMTLPAKEDLSEEIGL